jgi:hypothetical protein
MEVRRFGARRTKIGAEGVGEHENAPTFTDITPAGERSVYFAKKYIPERSSCPTPQHFLPCPNRRRTPEI